MKRTLLILFVAFSSMVTYGQTALSAAQQKQTIEQIDKAAQAVKTMQCSFAQVKTMKLMKNSINSSGQMWFSKPGKLRWQYTKPYDYTFIMNGSKAYMKSAKSTQTVDVNKNKMFKQIADVIMGCIVGGNMSKTGYFKIAMYKSGNSIYANLIPQKKELKQLYSSIVLYFNSSLTMVTKVEMKEKNGDKTTITLSGIKTNGNISEKIFSVN